MYLANDGMRNAAQKKENCVPEFTTYSMIWGGKSDFDNLVISKTIIIVHLDKVKIISGNQNVLYSIRNVLSVLISNKMP